MSVDYCLYYGGSSSETGKDVIVDDSGIYPLLHVTGNTFSSDFPVLNGYDSSFNGVSDCFVLEVVDAPGSPSLSYSTFVGGAGLDLALSIIGDSSGNLYVTGATSSTDFPTTSPAYNTSFSGGTTDVFLFKLGPDGESLLYSSYIGGSLEDMGSSISLDSSGFTYITGTTNSTDFPVTANAMNDTHNGFYDCFLLRMDTSDGSLGYSTFFGGSGLDGGLSISVGTSNNVYVLGVTMSPDLPISSGAFNETYGGGADCFVFRHTETIGPSVSVSQTPLSPSYTDPVTVEVTITDLDSTVVSAAIYYRTSSDGISWSDYTVIVMSNPTPDNYRGIIPVQPYNTQVEYYVFTQDSLLNPTISSAAYTVGDGTAPVVSNVVHDPLSPSVNQQVTVTATTSDNSGSGIQTVEIHYRTRLSADAWSDWTIVSMTSQGGETYAGAIPAQAQTEVQYFVSATDAASNEGTSTTLSYIVGPDLLETLLLVGEIGALIGLFGGGAVWIWRRMKKRGSEEPTTGVEK